MRRIAYCCPFVPPELISACRLQPRPIIPRASSRVGGAVSVAGMCPYARAFVAEMLNEPRPGAVILTTRCDQMRRAADLLSQPQHPSVFLLNLPKTWQTRSARELYHSELARLVRFLAELSGHMPSDQDLAQSTRQYAHRRRFQNDSTCAPAARSSGTKVKGGGNSHVPLALVGGPLLREHLAVFDLVSACGGRIILNATESGERSLPGQIDESQLACSPFNELTRIYFEFIPDVFQRPGTRLLNWIEDRLRDRPVRGLIVHRYVWCDLWHAQVARLRDRFDLPLLDLDHGDQDGPNTIRLSTRVQAFLEALR
ncbi:MAG: 2-hydroxyacyl-CoA dehydratase family protein [Phycisphaerae bacterium]|nr:2-hydroxyacyl-CoA dehydratase family protein [Phycisphaerae bacterium]